MKPLHIRTIFLLLAFCSCISKNKNSDISNVRKSFEKTISFTNSKLSDMLSYFDENDCPKGFELYYDKAMEAHRISIRFYKLADSMISNKSIHLSQIKRLRKSYKTTVDSLKSFHFNRFNDIKFIDNDYDSNNETSEYCRLMALMLKNDLILNEIEILRSIYNKFYNGDRFSRKFAVCDPETKPSKLKYSFRVLLAESKYGENIIKIKSITRNNSMIPIEKIIDTISEGEIVRLIQLGKGNYELKGELVEKISCTGNTIRYPFIHRFTVFEE